MSSVPWGMTRVTGRLPVSVRAVYPVLDPDTQCGVWVGADGQPIEAGKHGEETTYNTATKSGGQTDGGGPSKPQQDDDSTVDYKTE